MPLKKSQGNMYDWVTHTHSHLGGQCPHQCSYCYVQRNRFGISPRYQGNLRLIENEFDVNYGTGKIIFIEHMNDMFADDVPDVYIQRILEHCQRFNENKYVIQTKNPSRVREWVFYLPSDFTLGTTIESNRPYVGISKAPSVSARYLGMLNFLSAFKTFVTIEPILDFDVDIFVDWLSDLRPSFVNIGADSKHCGLLEPSPETVKALIAGLQERGITIKKKTNLERLLK